jgi:hypothetical protein
VFFDHLELFLWKSSFQFVCPFLHWVIDFGGSLMFWAPCIFWLLIPGQMYSWQRFSPILWTASGDHFFWKIAVLITVLPMLTISIVV